MRFIKLIFTFMVLVLMIPCVLQAQNTAPVSTTFEILKPTDRMIYFAEGMVQARNTYGSPVRWVSANNDSVGDTLKNVERHWKIGISSIGALSPDTGHITVTVHTRDPKGEDLILPYTATLHAHQQIEVNNPDWPIPGISIMMDDSVTAQYAPGDSFEIVYLRRSFNPHTTSRLTIVPTNSDSLEDNSDTTYGLAVPGDKRWMRWSFTGITSSTTDDNGENYLGWGLQYKNIGDADWGAIALKADSFPLIQGTRRDSAVIHMPADSVRTAHWGVGTTVWLYLTAWWTGAN